MTDVVRITDETFDLATNAQPIVVVDFWAAWCGPCRALSPVMERLAERYAGRVTVAALNVDENEATAERFRVRSIPALLFFKDGRLVDRTVGALPESIIAAKLDRLVSPEQPAESRLAAAAS